MEKCISFKFLSLFCIHTHIPSLSHTHTCTHKNTPTHAYTHTRTHYARTYTFMNTLTCITLFFYLCKYYVLDTVNISINYKIIASTPFINYIHVFNSFERPIDKV